MSQVTKSFTSKEYRVSYPVEEEFDGMRLDQFVQIYFTSFSRQFIKKKIRDGEVIIHGRPHSPKASSKVYHKDQVEIISINHEGELKEKPQVVFEDEHILVTTKPPFVTTHPTGKHLFHCLTVFYEEIYGHTIHSIHRLDRETSGVQVLGKSPYGANLITPFFEQGKVEKAYFFISKSYDKSPLPNWDEENHRFEANERLGQDEKFIPRLFTHCYPHDSDNGKHAKTTFQVLHHSKDHQYALGIAFPKTGRQHQIRAHAAHYGLPLLGDKLYNGDVHIFTRYQDGEALEEDEKIMEINRQALHAMALKFPYPNKKQAQIFRAPIPQDLRDWIQNKLDLNIDELELQIEQVLKDWL